MAPDNHRFKLKQFSWLSNKANIAVRAATATTWASSSCGDDVKFKDNDENGDDNKHDCHSPYSRRCAPTPSDVILVLVPDLHTNFKLRQSLSYMSRHHGMF